MRLTAFRGAQLNADSQSFSDKAPHVSPAAIVSQQERPAICLDSTAAVGATAGSIARATFCMEGAVAAQAPHGRGGELRAEPVDGTKRVLLRWSGQHRQQHLGARDEARCSQSQEQPLRWQSTWRQNGGDPGKPHQHLPPARYRPPAVSHAVVNELIAGAQERTAKLAPRSVETPSGGTQALDHLYFTQRSPSLQAPQRLDTRREAHQRISLNRWPENHAYVFVSDYALIARFWTAP